MRADPKQPAVAPPLPPPVLCVDRASKWYGPVIGLNQVSLELRPGIVGLVGANGCGKTTLMRLAAGLLRPDIGKVRVNQHDPAGSQGKLHLGYCPDVDRFYEEMSGRQFVETMARLFGFSRSDARQRTETALEQVGMADRSDRKLAGYSKGMRQRIKLAQALTHDPQLLLLDEPLSGIDPLGRADMIDVFNKLAQQNKCLLISSHELEELEKLTDYVAIMARGRLAAVGPIAQIRNVLADHPLSVLVGTDRPRELASLLLHFDEVQGMEIVSPSTLVIRARQPQRFFAELNRLIIEEDIQVDHLETLDDSTQAVLGYLLGGH